MPTYSYICDCGKEFEIEQKITEPALKKCPFNKGGKCYLSNKKPHPVKRLIASSNFILAGGGWYKDGYCKPCSDQKKNDSTTTQGKTCPCEK